MSWENPKFWPTLKVSTSDTLGNSLIGQQVAANSMPVVLASDQSLSVNGTVNAFGSFQPIPGTTGGLSMFKAIVPNNVTGVVVKASPGMIYAIEIFNNSAVIAYLKLYDASSAPTAGAGTIVKTIMFPAPTAGGGGGVIYMPPTGLVFATGIAYTVTTLIADIDATAPAASAYAVNIDYK